MNKNLNGKNMIIYTLEHFKWHGFIFFHKNIKIYFFGNNRAILNVQGCK